MRVNEIAPGSRVCLDANVFIYHFCGRSRQATELLLDVEDGQLHGFTTSGVLAEVLHRLMVIEAVSVGAISGASPARALRRRPEVVRALRRYYRDTSSIPAMGVEVIEPGGDLLRASHPLRTGYGLLTNDSLLVAAALGAGMDVLATADRDLARVREIDIALLDDVST